MLLRCVLTLLVNDEIMSPYGIYIEFNIEFRSEVNIALLLYVPFSLTSIS